MIYVCDNFLSEKEFSELRELIPKRYLKKRFDTLKVDGAIEPIRYEFHSKTGDYEEGSKFLGQSSFPAIQKLLETFHSFDIPAVNYSLWFAYMFTGMRNIAHRDGALRHSMQKHTYTTMLYTSEWEKDWGGELVFGDPVFDDKGRMIKVIPKQIIEPLPNRQVIWSRDEAHEVYVVKHPDKDFVRCSFGSGWSSVDDRPSK